MACCRWGTGPPTITDGEQSMDVSFSVVSWEVYPPDGGEVASGETTGKG